MDSWQGNNKVGTWYEVGNEIETFPQKFNSIEDAQEICLRLNVPVTYTRQLEKDE